MRWLCVHWFQRQFAEAGVPAVAHLQVALQRSKPLIATPTRSRHRLKLAVVVYQLQGIERLQQQISRSLASCPPADGATRLQLEIHLQQLERRKRGLMLEPAKTSEQDKTTQGMVFIAL